VPARYWTSHWQNRYWRPDVNPEREPVDHAAGSNLRKRGISQGDVAYVISLSAGQLLLGGRMTVKGIISYDEAIQHFGHSNFWEAPEHLIGVEGSGSPLDLHRALEPAVTKRLRFAFKDGPRQLCFVSETELDNQATRGVKELTAESAALLDRALAVTDGRSDPRGTLLVVTEAMLATEAGHQEETTDFQLPEETMPGSAYFEGAVRRIEVNRYERDSGARDACIAALGWQCRICGFDFANRYGQVGKEYIHVHHLRPLAEVGDNYVCNPVTDLMPVCPNCHAVLHRRNPPYDPAEVRDMLRQPSNA
jgi:hypothetical protein